jgi:hypothetical protein
MVMCPKGLGHERGCAGSPKVIKKVVKFHRWLLETNRDWPTDHRSQYNFEFHFEFDESRTNSAWRHTEYFHSSPASLKRRQKGNSVSRV